MMLCCTLLAANPFQPQVESDQDAAVRLIERGLNAMGGKNVLEAIESAVYFVGADGGLTDEFYFMRGTNDYLQIRQFATHETRAGRTDEFAWYQRIERGMSMTVELKAPTEPEYHFPLRFHRIVLDILPRAHTAAVINRETFEGVNCTEIAYEIVPGHSRRMLFADETGLPMRISFDWKTGKEMANVGIVFGGWERNGPIMMFKTIATWQRNNMGTPEKVSAFYVRTQDSVFEVPASVQELLLFQKRVEEADRRRTAISKMSADQVRTEIELIRRDEPATTGSLRFPEVWRDLRTLMSRRHRLEKAQDTR
jgi:hypothetical protein